MRKINYRLIVSDFDGTLIDDNQKILPQVKSAIGEYVDCGGIFAVCTGRMMRSILPQARNLGLKGLIVAYQGSEIADIESGELIKKSGINFESVIEICKFLEEKGCAINIYADEILYTNIPENDFYLARYEKITGIMAEHPETKLSQFVKDKKLTCQKVACLVHPEKQGELFKIISDEFSNNFNVTCSANCLIEIAKKGETKGEALKFIAQKYNVPIEKTVAVGDNLNDLSMIEAAGVGVAVGNAVDALKLAAKFVSRSNNDGAIAQIIEKYGFA